MTLPIANFVDVTINVNSVSIDRFSFGVPMGVFAHTLTSARQDGPYSTLAEMVLDGFTTATEPYKWANAVFSQSPSPATVLIGRRVPSTGDAATEVWQEDNDGGPSYVSMLTEFNDATDTNVIPFPATEAIEDAFYIGHAIPFSKVTFDYANGTAGVGGVLAWEYWNGSAWAALTGLTDATADFTTAAADGLVTSFTEPTNWQKTTVNGGASLYFIRARVTTVYSTNPQLDQGFVGGDATLTAALAAIELSDPDSWYATNIELRTDAELLELGAWIESRRKIGIVQTADGDLLAGIASNIGEQLKTLAYNQTALIYHDDDTEYLDGAWTGRGSAIDLDVPNGVGTWGMKALAGVPADDVNTSQATNVWAENANVYGKLKGLQFTADGKMASGRFIDITTTNHWFEARLEEEVLSLVVGASTKIPYDQSGLNAVGAAIQAVCDRGVLNGHFNGTDSPPLVKVPDIATVDAADKTARTATFTVNITYKGAIQSATLVVNAAF